MIKFEITKFNINTKNQDGKGVVAYFDYKRTIDLGQALALEDTFKGNMVVGYFKGNEHLFFVDFPHQKYQNKEGEYKKNYSRWSNYSNELDERNELLAILNNNGSMNEVQSFFGGLTTTPIPQQPMPMPTIQTGFEQQQMTTQPMTPQQPQQQAPRADINLEDIKF